MSSSAAGSERSSEVFERLLALDDRVAGMRADAYAYGLIDFDTTNAAFVRCMADAGFDYTPPPRYQPYEADGQADRRGPGYFDVFRTVDATLLGSEGFGYADGRARTLAWRDEVGPDPDPGAGSLRGARKQAWGAASNACLRVLPSSSSDFPLLPDVDDAYYRMLQEVAALPEVAEAMARYPSCMAERGYTVEDGEQLMIVLANDLNRLVRAGVRPGDPAWASYRSGEVRAAQADASCRSTAHALALDALAPRIAAFEQEHADEIAAGTAAARARRARAASVADRLGMQQTAARLLAAPLP